ncbi:hypothetical protein [Bremerella cremea]|uniref:hypothetical protein n=1 Tax=Bremerella cremea TaxID=1031537 RepID=UPI0011C06153|nr:hypothetical protein [Bremerella cremea]
MYFKRIESRGKQLLLVTAILCMVGCTTTPKKACPIDARNLYCGVGEEAVRRTPCGPDYLHYGYRATCWGTFPEGWGYQCPKEPAPAMLTNPQSEEMLPPVEHVEQIEHLEGL